MTKRQDVIDETAATKKPTTVHPPAPPEAEQPKAEEGRKQTAKASHVADAQKKAADELHAISERLNKLQHDDYIVPVANALKFVDQAIAALHQPPEPAAQPEQPAPADTSVSL